MIAHLKEILDETAYKRTFGTIKTLSEPALAADSYKKNNRLKDYLTPIVRMLLPLLKDQTFEMAANLRTPDYV